MIVLIRDPDYPGGLYHHSLLVHIEDIDLFNLIYPDCYLWNLGVTDPYKGFTWCWLDPTWSVPFDSTPSWLQYYIDLGGFPPNICSIAICDPDGAIDENCYIEAI